MKLYEPRRGLYWELGVTGDRVVYVEDGEIETVLPAEQVTPEQIEPLEQAVPEK